MSMADANALTIGILAEQSGCSVPTIRYYESVGLLRQAARKSGGHRVYGESDLRRLRFVRRCRDFDFSIDEVRMLAEVMEDGDRSCVEVRDLAASHLATVRAKLVDLRMLVRDLEQFVNSCENECGGGAGPQCAPLKNIADSRATETTRSTVPFVGRGQSQGRLKRQSSRRPTR